MKIANSLKEIRIEKSITQPEAAKIVGVPFRTYCRYEIDAHSVSISVDALYLPPNYKIINYDGWLLSVDKSLYMAKKGGHDKVVGSTYSE